MCRAIIAIAIVLSMPVCVSALDNEAQSGPLEEVISLLGENKTSEALKTLSSYKPSSDNMSGYHYAYAKALRQSGRLHDAIEHLRLACLYSPNKEMKERISFDRADTYMKMGYYGEASISFRIFLRDFQSSSFFRSASTGLADSLFKLGRFHEAFELYEKAGNETSALYWKANTLQAMGRTNEAYTLYMSLIGRDQGYLDSSPETVYLIGENLRQMGKFHDARAYLLLVKDPLLKFRADLSLGRIDLQEEGIESALKYFQTASKSPDRRVRRSTLLSLAGIYMNSGRTEEAESSLLEIRNNYPYGKEYDDAIFMLAGLYKKQGKAEKALPLLKELVFRGSPDQRALDEFEAMMLEASGKDPDESGQLWESVGTWLLNPARHKSLLKIAEGLQHEPRSFVKIHTYLSKYGPQEAKADSLLALAEFYAGIGDAAASLSYLQRITAKTVNEEILRVRAKIFHMNGEYDRALDVLSAFKKTKKEDVFLLSDIVGSAKGNKKGVRLLEKTLDKGGGPLSAYVTLADILYENGRKADAAKYYSSAVSETGEDKEDPTSGKDDREWALYRLSVILEGEMSREALTRIQKNKGTLGSLADARLRELGILERIRKVL